MNIAGRMAEGATEHQAIRESLNGVVSGEAKRRLALLREELSHGRTEPSGMEAISTGEPATKGDTVTELATKRAAENDDVDFSASAFDLPVPRMDGRKATNLEIRFSGSGVLDRTSEDDLELLKAARLGKPIRLIVVGEVSGKGFRLNRKPTGDEDLSYSCTVKVLSVEDGELAD